MEYVRRHITDTIKEWLNFGKIIIITGARQVGKTTLLKRLFTNSNEVLWLNADEQGIRERLGDNSIDKLRNIVGDYKFVIIDEVQRIPNAGLLLKILHDNFKPLQILATGSSALEISETIFEPLTGRHIFFHLPPLSIKELYPHASNFEIENNIHFHLQYGCYPEICTHRTKSKILLKNLANQYLYKDVLIWKDIRKPELLDKLLKLLAMQLGNQISMHELGRQLNIKSETLESYIDLLEKSFVIFRLKAFSRNPRKEITKMDKVYFWDLGIRNAIIDNFSGIIDRLDKGALFENFVIAERMKLLMNAEKQTQFFFWRNYNQSEVDLIEISDQKISAIEIKWSTRKNNYVSKAFTNAYPEAKTQVISPENVGDFIRGAETE